MKAKFHLQFVTEIEGCHQSFPFLAIGRRLEDKKRRASYEQTDELVQFLWFGKKTSFYSRVDMDAAQTPASSSCDRA